MVTLSKGQRLVKDRTTPDKWVHIAGTWGLLRFVASPNDRYWLAWDKGGHSLENGVKREKVPYYLAEDGFIIAEGTMEQPKNGVVANNGNFAFSNIPVFDSGESEFLVFDKTGKCIYEKVMPAYINRCGIAANGQLAVYQTFASKSSNDSWVIVLVNTQHRRELWRKGLWGNDGFEFYSDRLACLGRDYAYYYSLKDGVLLNLEDWLIGNVGSASGYAVRAAAEQEAERHDLHRAILLMGHALKCTDVQEPESQSWILRCIGEWYEELADSTSALDYYEKALALNAKVGVKKKATALRKQLGNVSFAIN